MSGQIGFYFDASLCIGCKTCSVACKDKNSQPAGVNIRKIYEYGGGTWVEKDGYLMPSEVRTHFVSASCMHCEKPACVGVCPVSAITKRKSDGAVIIDRNKCIGCRSCEEACPYKAPSFDKSKDKMYKCDFCADMLAEGKNPICVDACLQRCLKTGNIDELRKKYGAADALEPIPQTDTKPSVVFNKPDNFAKSSKTPGRIRNKTEI